MRIAIIYLSIYWNFEMKERELILKELSFVKIIFLSKAQFVYIYTSF